jgi:electron transfer flavoprotein alpha subunit
MPIVLIVAEQQPDGALRKATLNAIAAGKQLAEKSGAELHVVALAKDAAKLADELKQYGAKVVHAGSSPVFEHYLAEAFAPVVADLAQSLKSEFVGAASTAQGKDLMPRVAARLRAAMATDVMRFEGSATDITFTRPMWTGNVIADVKLATPVKAFTVRTTEFPLAQSGSSSPADEAPRATSRRSRRSRISSARRSVRRARWSTPAGSRTICW